MKKIFIIFSCLCPISFVFAADQWDEQHIWSYHALADTLENVHNQCNVDTADMLVQLSDFVNANNAELSVRQLVDKCLEISGSGACDVIDNNGIEAWTETLNKQDNEFCDVFVSEFVQNQNSYAGNMDNLDVANGSAYYGCSNYTNIIRDGRVCDKKFASNAREKSRCKNCTAVAGTYENGRCFIEIVAWNCTGKGWVKTTNNPLKCAEANKYHDCRMIHKYVDAERAFTCDAASILGTKRALLSGCAQHGCSSGAKHPPFHITGDKGQDCKLPLANNTAWRVPYTTGAAVGVVRNGANVMTTDWCMPAKDSNPWNSSNDNGRFKHLCAPTLVGGQSISRWHSID